MSDPARFWDKIARKYAESPVRNPEAYAETLARVRAHLKPEDRVLEIGCGTASTALTLRDAVAEIVATDISHEMTAIGQEKAAAAEADTVTCRQWAPGAPSLPQAPFDVIMAFNFLHLVPDVPETLAQISPNLKPGGLLITKSTCLMEKGFPLLWPLVALLRAIGKAPAVNFFSISKLETWITQAGFEILETGNYPSAPPCRFVVARKRLEHV